MTVRHGYFQTLSTDDFDGDIDVCWEQELPVGGGSVRVALWAGSDADLTAAALDAFAAFLARLDEADQAARATIAAYLVEDGEYISLHEEEIEDAEYPQEPAAFAQAMRLTNIGLWASDPDAEDDEDGDDLAEPIVMDYNIDPERSDQLLAVKFGLDGKITGIDWES
ncbi:DUF2004 domain-containing protein [Kingella denitrificans]